jgi:hypothetical protein
MPGYSEDQLSDFRDAFTLVFDYKKFIVLRIFANIFTNIFYFYH